MEAPVRAMDSTGHCNHQEVVVELRPQAPLVQPQLQAQAVQELQLTIQVLLCYLVLVAVERVASMAGAEPHPTVGALEVLLVNKAPLA